MKGLRKEMSMGRYVVCLGIVLLGLIGLTLLLSSCEKEALGEGNGKIAIHFTLGSSSFGGGEEVTRSAGRQAVLERVQSPVSEGMYVEGTLEEDAGDVLRDGPVLEQLAVGILMRIVAFNSNGDIVSHGMYKVKDASGAIESVGQGVSVPSQGTYTFVAYSFNNSTESHLPAANGTLKSIFVNGSLGTLGSDFLWGKTESSVDEGDENNVEIVMRHMGSKVRVKVKSDEFQSSDQNITVNPYGTRSDFKLTCMYNMTLTVLSGAMVHTGSTSEFVVNTSWTGTGTSTITSDAYRIIYQLGAPYKVWVMYLKVGDYYYSATIPVTFTTALQPGHSYTLTLSLKRMDLVFAGSNIYWKDVSNDQDPDYPGYLTFESQETVTDDSKRYQGLYFQWGSLVGISPSQLPYVGEYQKYNVFAPESTPIYVPDYTSGETPSFAWRKTTASAESWTTWDGLPRVTDNTSTITDRENTYLNDDARNTETNWGAKTGDICRYIVASGHGPLNDVRKWRMPVSIEMGTDRNATPVGISVIPGWEYTSSPDVSDGNEEGTYLMAYYMTHIVTGIVFPLTGYREPLQGRTYTTSTYYWTATPAYQSNARYCLMSTQIISNESSMSRLFAMPIRCIVDNAIDASQP